MARTYKKSAKSEPTEAKKLTPIEEALAASEPTAEKGVTEKVSPDKAVPEKAVAAKPVKTTSKPSSKPASSVIAAPSAAIGQIVYQPSSQILTRNVGPNESFGVGDDMPIYYL